jgi:hypothetical protein
MSPDRAIERLKAYEQELAAIASRFTRSRDSLHMGPGDDSRLHQTVIELRDLFDDLLGQNSYTGMIVNAYNEGVNNFLRTPSLNSVKQVKSIVSSAITRIEENPGLIKQSEETNPPQSVATQTALELPERVTLHWLYKNVPYRFWLGIGSLLIAAFVLGASAALKLPLIQQWFGLACGSSVSG